MENTLTEKHLIDCLDGSTGFMQKVLDEGFLDAERADLLRTFMLTQIESNKMTIRKYKIIKK